MNENEIQKVRILIIDDNNAIHEDYKKALAHVVKLDLLEDLEANLFEIKPAKFTTDFNLTIDSAYQGDVGFNMINAALKENKPYALVFVDIRMPPGWDGLETIKRIWQIDQHIQTVICTAYSDHSWDEIQIALGVSDRLLILKKPFDLIEIRQLTMTLVHKWLLEQTVLKYIMMLESTVTKRTEALRSTLALVNATIESAGVGIIAVNKKGNIILYNKYILKSFNIQNEPLKEKHVIDFFEKYLMINNIEYFISLINSLLSNPSEINKELQFSNNQTFEFCAIPQLDLDNSLVIGMVFSFKNITERKKMENQLLLQATHDVLTKLPNRALLLDRLAQAILTSKNENNRVGVLFFDVDNFKYINDNYGHEFGDKILCEIAIRVSSILSERDTLSRLAADEFIVVIANKSKVENYIDVAKEIQNVLMKPFKIDRQEIALTTSVGISLYPDHGVDADTLLRNADAALYVAKESERGVIKIYDEEFNAKMAQALEYENALLHAIENKELLIHFQPIFELNKDNITGVEALVRWRHPKLGVIAPLDFIPLAESKGIIVSIGNWVLKSACNYVKSWFENGIPPIIRLSVNISPIQFSHVDFIEMVTTILQETGFDPNLLEFELTESSLLGDTEDVLEKMEIIKNMGIHLVIDDFGTGYASLSYLKKFPFEKIKIDKSFIQDFEKRDKDSLIIEAIIKLSKKMKLEVLAEGVETEEQLNFIKKQFTNQVQGYLFSKPLEEKACFELLKSKLGNKSQ